MNRDRIEGSWKQLKGNIRQQWGKLTDDELDVIAGQGEKRSGTSQKTHGNSRDEVDEQMRNRPSRQRSVYR